MILKRGTYIFCYSILVKFFIECFKNKLNFFKVFKNSPKIIKFALAMGPISLNFLLFRWSAGRIRNYAGIRNFLKNHPKINSFTEKMELVIAGLLSSRAVMWLEPADRNLIKLVIYMRGVEAFFQILYTHIRRIHSKQRDSSNENCKISRCFTNDQNLNRPTPACPPKSLRQTHFPLFITTIFTAIYFYGYIFEPNNLHRSAVARMNTIAASTPGEKNLIACFREVTKMQIKK